MTNGGLQNGSISFELPQEVLNALEHDAREFAALANDPAAQ